MHYGVCGNAKLHQKPGQSAVEDLVVKEVVAHELQESVVAQRSPCAVHGNADVALGSLARYREVSIVFHLLAGVL